MNRCYVTYEPASNCKNENVYCHCVKCGKCGRTFNEYGFMVGKGRAKLDWLELEKQLDELLEQREQIRADLYSITIRINNLRKKFDNKKYRNKQKLKVLKE